MGVKFDFTDQGVPSGLGFMQFDEEEIELGVPRDLPSLMSSGNFMFSVGSPSSREREGYIFNTGTFYGDIIIDELSPGVFAASFSAGTIYDEHSIIDTDHHPIKAISLEINNSGTAFNLADTNSFPSIHLSGVAEGSVWFDDPAPTIPLPPTAVLMVSALLTLFAVKKRCKT